MPLPIICRVKTSGSLEYVGKQLFPMLVSFIYSMDNVLKNGMPRRYTNSSQSQDDTRKIIFALVNTNLSCLDVYNLQEPAFNVHE